MKGCASEEETEAELSRQESAELCLFRGVDPSTLRFLASRLRVADGHLAQLRARAAVARSARAQTLDVVRSTLQADEAAQLRSETLRRRSLGGTISAAGMAILIAGMDAAPQLQMAPILLALFFAWTLLVADLHRRSARRERERLLERLGRPTGQAALAGDLGPQWWDAVLASEAEAEAELEEMSERWDGLAGRYAPEAVECLLAGAEVAWRQNELRCAVAEAEALARALAFDASDGGDVRI
ncbi:MAG: hypothetical protein ACRDV9_02135 [Acidimicrobiia bacterium]